jgi:hypothetical protein
VITILGDNFFNNFTTQPLPIRVSIGNTNYSNPIIVNQNTITLTLTSGTSLTLGQNLVKVSLDAGVSYTEQLVYFTVSIACPGSKKRKKISYQLNFFFF